MRHRKLKKINYSSRHKLIILRELFYKIIKDGAIKTKLSIGKYFLSFFNKLVFAKPNSSKLNFISSKSVINLLNQLALNTSNTLKILRIKSRTDSCKQVVIKLIRLF